MASITVLMAVYDGERYLPEAIESILNQSHTDFEFLIVNDGSTDRTREIILSYPDSRIRLIDNECNLGLAPSLNRGIAEAKGALIARQDADDISYPHRLARQYAYLQENPQITILGTYYDVIDEQGRLLESIDLPSTTTDIRWALLFYCPFVHTAMMMRREILLEVGRYDETLTYSMDYDLWRRIARRWSVANLDERHVKLRVHDASMTATWGERAQEGYRLRLNTVSSLLNWQETELTERQTRFDRMLALQSAHPATVPLRAVPGLIIEIWRLQHAFYRFHDLSPVEAQRHRRKMLRLFASQLRTIFRQRLRATLH